MIGPRDPLRRVRGRGAIELVALVGLPIVVARVLGAMSSQLRSRKEDPADRSTIVVTVVDPKAPKPGQAFVYADPPATFAPIVHVVAIEGDRAEIAVRDLEARSRFLPFMIEGDALRASLLRAATRAQPGPRDRDEEPGDCGARTLAVCLGAIDFFRHSGQVVPAP